MSEKKTILLIDLSALFWSAWKSSGEDLVSAARERTLAAVQRCKSAAPDSLVAICCDSGRSFRRDMSPTYKANRPEKDHAVIGELERTIERLRCDGEVIWAAPGLEADDVIATATATAVKTGHCVVIATGDKDLYQLIDDEAPSVSVLSTQTWEMRRYTDVVDKFGVSPMALGDLLALMGDKSDNVPGCPGVGPKRGAELLIKHKDLAGIFSAIRDVVNVGTDGQTEVVTRALGTVELSLRDNEGAVGLARELVRLRFDAPIKFDEIYQERKQQPLADVGDADMESLDEKHDEKHQTSSMLTVEEQSAGRTNAPTAMVTVEPRPLSSRQFETDLEPNTGAAALVAAKLLYSSRLYSQHGNPESVWAVIIRGRELGLKMGESLMSFHVVKGRVVASAQLLIALAKRHPDCEYFQCIESTDTACTFETMNRRNPKPTTHKYTIEEATAAGMLRPSRSGEPSAWESRKREMLRKTCGSQLSRLEYPDAILGLYCSAEIGEDDE